MSTEFVVSGHYHSNEGVDYGVVIRIDKTNGEIIKAEGVEGLNGGIQGIKSHDASTTGDIMGVGYRTGPDGYNRGVIMRFQNDGKGCDVVDIMDKFINVTEPVFNSGTHVKSFNGPSGWKTDLLTTVTNPDPSILVEKCTRECYGVKVINLDDTPTCSEHGVCQDWDDCNCNPLYPGDNCEEWSCWGIPNTEINKFCGNNDTGFFVGYCVDIDSCFCIPGYSAQELNRECLNWMCGKFDKDDKAACTGMGECIKSQECSCKEDYEGAWCDTWSCGADYKEKATCSGHGQCTKPNKCNCKSGYAGKLCETNMMYYTVMAPVLSTFGLGTAFMIGLLILAIVFLIICCCFTVICVYVCGFCGICCLGCIVVVQKARMKKFGKLKNIDILLREQEMESDESVAHLNISKDMFEISYDEIHLESINGEGGSSSVVYRAKWQKQTVAFKCFKTRQVCSDQNSFDEFEAEVKVMSSISHPNIIRFFGGSLQPPRVGIVMEFCENGDLCIFLKNYSRDNEGQFYPLEEKVRMMHEIASAMEYLHSRKILHRDLKLENVLVDSSENCKLMDFGLSKIVERISRAQTKQIGTNIYMSPEIVKSGHYDEKTDVFSMGILIFILVTQNWNPYGQDERLVEVRVSQDPTYRPPLEEFDKAIRKGDVWMKKLMMCCWDDQSSVRKSFSEILEIIEERTVVEDALEDYNSEELASRDSVTVRSHGSKRKTRSKNMDGSEFEIKLEEKDAEIWKLRKKERIMRRQLFIVQKEKERLTRVLRNSNVDYMDTSAPSAPSRESKQGVKDEIRRELDHAKKSSSLKVLYKMAPPPPDHQQKQPKRMNIPSSIPQRSSPLGPPIRKQQNELIKRNVLYQAVDERVKKRAPPPGPPIPKENRGTALPPPIKPRTAPRRGPPGPPVPSKMGRY